MSEMQEKRELYFERGAHEVWLCDENREFQFFNADGKTGKSEMFLDFPGKIEI